MYALIQNGKVKVYPYTLGEFRRDNPQVSLPENVSDALLAELGLQAVEETPVPSYDPTTQYVTLGPPKLVSKVWKQTWVVNSYTQDQLNEIKQGAVNAAVQQRLQAYREEADPLFFKAQRGEATMQEWKDKVEEIKKRYPKP